jgi:SAM-dependent methyltransferase
MTERVAEVEDPSAGVRHFTLIARREGLIRDGASGLVAGCRDGAEAVHLHRALGARVVGIDVDLPEEGEEGHGVRLQRGDVLELVFGPGEFDFVFYHHVIEHVPDPERSLAEIARVLRPGGWLYVGTPNRHRIAGYLGSGTTLREKLAWNLNDYRARATGRFRNELGAHAGFSRRELEHMLGARFSHTRWLTADYLRFKYGERAPEPVVALVTSPPLLEVVAPSIYALCRR